MKLCSKCKNEKTLDSFRDDWRYRDNLRCICRDCDTAQHKEWRLKYPDKAREHDRRRRKRKYIKEKAVPATMQYRQTYFESVIGPLKAVPCMDCGGTFPAICMDFDHVRGTKKHTISDMMRASPHKTDLLDEIAKCDVVCSNCHRIRTIQRRKLRQ